MKRLMKHLIVPIPVSEPPPMQALDPVRVLSPELVVKAEARSKKISYKALDKETCEPGEMDALYAGYHRFYVQGVKVRVMTEGDDPKKVNLNYHPNGWVCLFTIRGFWDGFCGRPKWCTMDEFNRDDEEPERNKDGSYTVA